MADLQLDSTCWTPCSNVFNLGTVQGFRLRSFIWEALFDLPG